MAAVTKSSSSSPTLPSVIDAPKTLGMPKSKRKLQKHLRSAGLAYISRTGKLIPAKKVADELCQCPQKCDDRVPIEARDNLFNYFYRLGDADMQNQFLRENMDLRARLNIPETTESGRPPRRITCKYLVPLLPGSDHVEVCQKAFVSAFVITTKRVRLQREKLISSLGLNSYSSHNRSTKIPLSNNPSNNMQIDSDLSSTCLNETKIPANNNNNNNISPLLGQLNLPPACDLVMEQSNEPKKVQNNQKYQRASNNRVHLVKRQIVDNPLIPFGLLLPDGVTIAPVTATPDHDRDIAIVNNFFSNQLWKPEYIGTYS